MERGPQVEWLEPAPGERLEHGHEPAELGLPGNDILAPAAVRRGPQDVHGGAREGARDERREVSRRLAPALDHDRIERREVRASAGDRAHGATRPEARAALPAERRIR